MEKRLKEYLKTLERIAEQARRGEFSPQELEAQRREALVQIGFFQHERLVHLIVTMTFAVLTVVSLMGCVLSGQLSILALTGLLLILLVPYIRHYYLLENGVQKLYTYYDEFERARIGGAGQD